MQKERGGKEWLWERLRNSKGNDGGWFFKLFSFLPEQKFQMNKILMCEINKSREDEETKKKFDVQERGWSEKNFLIKVRKKRAMEWWERGENPFQEGRKEGYMKSTCVPFLLADSCGCWRDSLSSAPLCFPVTSFLCCCLAHSQSSCSLPFSLSLSPYEILTTRIASQTLPNIIFVFLIHRFFPPFVTPAESP